MPSPVLVTMADFYGTLAAVRSLGRLGIPVTVADSRLLAPARWSRFATRRIQCPSASDPEAYLRWLLDFGSREPGHILYPTSDELAFLYSKHRDELSKNFRMYQPSLEAIYALLCKKHLYLAADKVGLDRPDTHFPVTEEEIRSVAELARYPVLIKPRTQIFLYSHVKGVMVERPADLPAKYAEFRAKNPYGELILRHDPDAAYPMVQAFHTEAAQAIYNLSGFVDQEGKLLAVRAAVKVLQRPRKLGIGLCFEEAAVVPALAEKLAALSKKLGYYGVFEVEFIQSAGKYLLIDFNPRFYSQMAFDIARGLPLAEMVHAAAVGDKPELKRLAARAQASSQNGLDRVYCHRFILELMLRAQRLSGRLSPEEVASWRRWFSRNREGVVDAVMDGDDWVPAMVDLAQHLYGYARHPRAFLRQMVLDK